MEDVNDLSHHHTPKEPTSQGLPLDEAAASLVVRPSAVVVVEVSVGRAEEVDMAAERTDEPQKNEAKKKEGSRKVSRLQVGELAVMDGRSESTAVLHIKHIQLAV